MRGKPFQRFIGVDLGGGKGKKTAVAVLSRNGHGGATVERVAPRLGEKPLYDDRLVQLIQSFDDAPSVVAIDAPLSQPACLRCQVPVCPGQEACEDPAVRVMRRLATDPVSPHRDYRRGKPVLTPYTQRATEVYLHRRRSLLPHETPVQSTGPLAARAMHLARALAGTHQRGESLIEVLPKATVSLLRLPKPYKRHIRERETRVAILAALEGELAFAPGVWREECVQSDHVFDAVICALTAFLWARDGWRKPDDLADLPSEDGWIWVPPEPEATPQQDGQQEDAPGPRTRHVSGA
ncbi:MAG: DUF429 domain-containing protein [Myxococcales bacterium]|nr:DUF429 domain-containing protein [Myxococcales bacterium]